MKKNAKEKVWEHATLRQLKEVLPNTTGIKRPTAKFLRTECSLICEASFQDSHIQVYDNGFATYTKGRSNCVLYVALAGAVEYRYEIDGCKYCDTVSTEDELWSTALFLDGEERLEMQYRNHASKVKSLTGAGVIDDERDDAADMDLPSEENIEEEYIQKENQEAIRTRLKNIILHLNQTQRKIIYLRFVEKKTYQEIADVLGIKKQSVYEMLQVIKKKAKKF